MQQVFEEVMEFEDARHRSDTMMNSRDAEDMMMMMMEQGKMNSVINRSEGDFEEGEEIEMMKGIKEFE